ncbi:DUF2293 domain-containing protein [Actinorugispora endophytica]|uniref:DUF2293 domain-containing protein n=1 Tax=Actinorugispora endophytica TaxID=1605990 RepID=UPI001FB6EC6D|nr:DUF2293 domain-containing protein [Actinorugispora endophytica]
MRQDLDTRLGRRVAAAAQDVLGRRGWVSPLDVLSGIGWLPWNLVDTWQQGRADCVEELVQISPDKLAAAVGLLRTWAEGKGLLPEEVAYPAATRDRRELRFTAGGDEELERAYRTHWVSPDLSEAKRKRVTERQQKAPDLVVVEAFGEWACAECGGSGAHLMMDEGRTLCLTCVDMDHLVFLPAGSAALTRRAKKESGLSAVVVVWNRRRKRYQRQGLLVEEAALERAEEQCLADEDARARRRDRDRVRRAEWDVDFQARMAGEIVRMFPGCPPERADRIARHAGERGSGRVGRSAAGRELDERAVRAAVVASVRHEDTDYDAMLMAGVPRETARERIASGIDRVLAGWENG